MLHNMAFLWGATAVVWLATFAYSVSLLRRQTRMQEEINQLTRMLEDVQKTRKSS